MVAGSFEISRSYCGIWPSVARSLDQQTRRCEVLGRLRWIVHVLGSNENTGSLASCPEGMNGYEEDSDKMVAGGLVLARFVPSRLAVRHMCSVELLGVRVPVSAWPDCKGVS